MALTYTPAARAADLYPAIGFVVGGGSLIGLDVTVPLGPDVSVAVDAGLRLGLSIEDVYPNANAGFVVGGELTKDAPVRHGVFATAGASAPLGFFDAWVGAGWQMVSYDRRRLRQFTLDVGPALYLVRNMPPETALTIPAFVYVRFVFHIPLAPAVPPPPPTLTHGGSSES